MSARRPRLLYLVHCHDNLGGVELHVRALAAGLRERYEVALAYPQQGQILLRQGDQVTAFAADPPAWPETPYRAPRTEQALDQIFRLLRPDLVHVQHFLHWPLSVIDQALATGARVLVSFHDYYAVTPQFTMQGIADAADAFSPAYARATFGRDISPYLNERRRVLANSLGKVHARIAVSPYLERQLQRVFPGDYRLIEYGIRPFQTPATDRDWPGLRFGCVGSLIPQKGWRSVYEAFPAVRRRHPGAELHFYGGPPANVPAADGITFHGAYRPQDLPRLCAGLDVAVIPSLFAETYCMVLSEMWQGGLPVAVSDVGALGERVTDGVNGKKFRPGDTAGIADALSWFVENDAWRHWHLPRPKTTADMVADYDRLYQELLAMAPTAAPPAAGLHADLLVVQVCEFLDVGDGVYRFHEPSRQLSRLPGVVVIDCDLNHRLWPALGEVADVLVLACFEGEMYSLLERRRAAGKVTVFEANDYYYDVQSWNPLSARWFDRGLQDCFHQGLTLCDAVQTSTPELARRWRERTPRPVAAFRNQLTDVPPLAPPPDRPLTVGWGGSPGHFADWYSVAPALEKWLAAHPQVHLAVMTSEFAKPFLQVPPERYHFTPFGSLADYLRFLRGLDVGLAPLLPTGYNRCRSDVKFLEYASQGVAGIYADLEPYRDEVVPEQTGLLYRTVDELIGALDRLAGDAELRQRIRRQAHDHVARHRRLEQHIGERLTFYRELLKALPRGQTVPAEVLACATRDERYLQLRRGRPEDTLVANVKGPTTKETVAALQRLVAEQPAYLSALQHLGRQLNDLRDFAGALPYLERARALNPHSARTLSEIGRSQYQLNQDQKARQTLEGALTLNPYFQLGWQYLLRLLQVTRAPEGPRWAERARRALPANFALALMGARLYPPPDALRLLGELLDTYAPTFFSEEVPGASAAFSETLRDLAGPYLGTPEALELFRKACVVFPTSALLATLFGRALHQAGRYPESRAEYARALGLRRVALTYRAEFPKEDGTIHYWQFAEHIRDVTGEGTNPKG